MIVLHGEKDFASPYVLSVFVTLHEKQLPFELKTIDLSQQDHRQSIYAHHSITQRVPTLEHDGFRLSESTAIIEYLEDRYPDPSVLPSDLQQRARARQIQAWIRSDLLPIRSERDTEVVFYGAQRPPLSQAAQDAVQKLIYATSLWLPDGRTQLFDRWSIADTDLAMMLMRLVANGDVIPSHLERYARTQWERPSVQKWLQCIVEK